MCRNVDKPWRYPRRVLGLIHIFQIDRTFVLCRIERLFAFLLYRQILSKSVEKKLSTKNCLLYYYYIHVPIKKG